MTVPEMLDPALQSAAWAALRDGWQGREILLG